MRHDEAIFMATHNSYATGTVGSLPQQLDSGVRGIELDLWPYAMDDKHDFSIGHLGPGFGVAFGNGNPNTQWFRDWLDVIRGWSEQHPDHVVITLILDVKAMLDPPGTPAGIDQIDGALATRLGTRLLAGVTSTRGRTSRLCADE